VVNMAFVIKKNKKRQTFTPAKIRRSIERAAREAKVSPKKIKKLMAEVADPLIKLVKRKRTVRASYLRKSILGRLDRRLKKVSNAWKKFDRKRR